MPTTYIPRNVERGAEFLDARIPGWEEKIDLDKLDLGSCCNCIVGQLNPAHTRIREDRYWSGIKELGVRGEAKHGFITWGTQTFDVLTEGWRNLIERRRRRRA